MPLRRQPRGLPCSRRLVTQMAVVSALCMLSAEAAAGQQPQCTNDLGRPRDCAVLIVHSYHPALGWNQGLSNGFRSAFTDVERIRIDAEYLDAKRRPELGHADAFLEILEHKYRAHPPDVLVISDDPAFELLWNHRQRLFPDVPIVFMGLNDVRDELRSIDGVTGIFEIHETERTIDLSLSLTGANGIIVINDTSETGRANEATLTKLMKARPDIQWVVERDLSVADIDRLTKYPADWPIVPMLPLREFGPAGPMLSQARSVQLLRASLAQPLFYDGEWLMGRGLVGGYMLDGKAHAKVAGELTAAILAGAAPEALAIRNETAHAWIFDGRELDRFGWKRAQLPAAAEIRFIPPTYLERHSEFIGPAAVVFCMAALVIVLLAATVRRQRQAELALRAQEQRLSTALAASDAGVFEIRRSNGYASPRWLDLLGVSLSDANHPEAWLRHVGPESRAAWDVAVDRLAKDGGRERLELEIELERRLVNVLLTTGRQPGDIIGVGTDITRQRRMETEAASRTRLQGLGELAGGIAHDFNNLLTIINGTTELLLMVDDFSEIRARLAEIKSAGARAADLVERLLLFGRRDHRVERPTDLNEPIRELHLFFQRLVGEAHEVVTLLHDEPLGVPLDNTDVEQVLSNLVINARDALPDGGPIYITTSIEKIHGRDWAVLTVRDEGIGMNEATRARVFEPFFTTKPAGEGSGLGLSTVWGIVSGSGGRVEVQSSPGAGTTIVARWVRVGLPRACDDIQAAPPTKEGGSILVVEDDPGVALLTKTLLTRAGYRVCVAADGREGLKIFREHPDDFDLVFSDLVLPHLSGVEMAQQIRDLRPSVRVGFCTGYSHHPSLAHVACPDESQLLRKPFSQRELRDFVSDCLSQSNREADDERAT